MNAPHRAVYLWLQVIDFPYSELFLVMVMHTLQQAVLQSQLGMVSLQSGNAKLAYWEPYSYCLVKLGMVNQQTGRNYICQTGNGELTYREEPNIYYLAKPKRQECGDKQVLPYRAVSCSYVKLGV